MNIDVVKSAAATAEKGGTIPLSCVERATGATRLDPDPFRLACLAFKEALESTLRANNNPMVVRITKDGIRLLTDSEAAKYTAKRFLSHRRGLRRSHTKAAEVSVANLEHDEIQEHEHNLNVQARQLQAMRERSLPPLRATAPRDG